MAAKKKNSEESQEEMFQDEKTFLAHAEKEYGASSVRDADELEDPAPNLTGSIMLDLDLRVPYPEGRIIEIYGPNQAGKTSLVLEALGQAQSAGKKIAFCDAEGKLTKTLVDGIRPLNPSKIDGEGNKTFKLLKGGCGEENLNLVRDYVRSFPGSVVGIDSVDALIPENVLQGDIGDSAVADLARLMSDGCRKLNESIQRSGATILFINQIRNKITLFGDPRTTSGGEALRFYADQRIIFQEVGDKQRIKADGGKVIGQISRYSVIKNKLSPPVSGEIRIIYGKGIHREWELAKLLKDLGLVGVKGKGGCYLQIEDKSLTMDKAAALFETDPDLYKKYYQMLMGCYK